VKDICHGFMPVEARAVEVETTDTGKGIGSFVISGQPIGAMMDISLLPWETIRAVCSMT
jgi:uncharacterized protein YceK